MRGRPPTTRRQGAGRKSGGAPHGAQAGDHRDREEHPATPASSPPATRRITSADGLDAAPMMGTRHVILHEPPDQDEECQQPVREAAEQREGPRTVRPARSARPREETPASPDRREHHGVGYPAIRNSIIQTTNVSTQKDQGADVLSEDAVQIARRSFSRARATLPGHRSRRSPRPRHARHRAGRRTRRSAP